MLKTKAIDLLLKRSGNSHLTDLYNPSMEVQVNVAQGDGKKIRGEYKGIRWTGWKNTERNV